MEEGGGGEGGAKEEGPGSTLLKIKTKMLKKSENLHGCYLLACCDLVLPNGCFPRMIQGNLQGTCSGNVWEFLGKCPENVRERSRTCPGTVQELSNKVPDMLQMLL